MAGAIARSSEKCNNNNNNNKVSNISKFNSAFWKMTTDHKQRLGALKRFKQVSLHSDFRGWAPKDAFETQCIMALQCHPRSLILAPIESA